MTTHRLTPTTEWELARLTLLRELLAGELSFSDLLLRLKQSDTFTPDLPLAPLLHGLEDAYLVRGSTGHPRRYRLTDAGRRTLSRLNNTRHSQQLRARLGLAPPTRADQRRRGATAPTHPARAPPPPTLRPRPLRPMLVT